MLCIQVCRRLAGVDTAVFNLLKEAKYIIISVVFRGQLTVKGLYVLLPEVVFAIILYFLANGI